ncbi:MAG: hypothetical protein JEZ08_16430 [Clostridiales bacterium]|nr:hypothetical protein [Clostridiales bacterium]
MKRIISVLIILLLLSISMLTYAETTNTTSEVEEQTEEDSNSQDKLDTMKKSNTEKLLDYEPEKSGEDKSLDQGIDSLTNDIRVLFNQFKEIWSEFSLFIVMALSMFSIMLFFLFKLLGVKTGMKASLTMAILPVMFFILYNIIGPFMTTLV